MSIGIKADLQAPVCAQQQDTVCLNLMCHGYGWRRTAHLGQYYCCADETDVLLLIPTLKFTRYMMFR